MSKPQFWINVEADQPVTWCGHALINFSAPAIAVMLISIFHNLGDILLWYCCFVTILAGYYIFVREQKDEVMHRHELKDWEIPTGRYKITPRLDKIGDAIGPAIAFFTAWMSYGIARVSWKVIGAVLGVSIVLLAIPAIKAIRRGGG